MTGEASPSSRFGSYWASVSDAVPLNLAGLNVYRELFEPILKDKNLEKRHFPIWTRKRGKTPGERGFSVGLLVRRIEISGRGIPESAIV